MPKYEVEFCDGKHIVKEANTAAEAKAQAKAERRHTLPPDTPRSAAEVKVARVVQIEAESADSRRASRARE